MKRLTYFVLALVLIMLVPLVTQAQVDTSGRISFDLRNAGNSVCSPDPREHTKICDFPAGTKEVEIVVSYENLITENGLAVALTDEYGNSIYLKIENVRDSGTKSYKVTGTDVYNKYLATIIDNTQTYSNTLSQRNGNPESQAASVLNSLEDSINIVRQLQRFTNPSTPPQLAEIITQLTTVQAKAKDVKPTISGQTPETQRALIQDAFVAARQAKQLLTAAGPALQGRTGLAFLNVDTANGRKMSGLLTRGGQAVESVDWAVSTTPIQRATVEPTRGPTNTPAPTGTPVPAAQLTAQVATIMATYAAGPSATLPAQPVIDTPTPSSVDPTATTGAAPTQTSQPVASATSAPTNVVPGAIPATATALRLPPGAPQPVLTASVPTVQPTTAAKAVAAPAAVGTAPPSAVASAAKAAVTITATTGAVALKTEAEASATPTTARVAGKVSFNLTPAADGTTRVAGQASGGGLPITTIGLVLVAVVLGGAALWMRRRV